MGKEEHAELIRSGSREQLSHRWRELIEWYSLLNLSFSDDKFPALSGLAKQMARSRPGAKYLAGLWSDSLEIDLIWWNDELILVSKSRTSRPTPPRAPSWSWAAIDGHVIFLGSSSQLLPTEKPRGWSQIFYSIIEVQCTLATSDPMGKVSSGSLKISGDVFDCKIFCNEGKMYLERGIGWQRLQLGTLWDDCLCLDVPDDPYGLGRGNTLKEAAVLCIRMARERREHGRQKETEFGMARGRLEHGRQKETEFALVVYCADEVNKTYRRIGMALQTRDYSKCSDPWLDKPSCFNTGGRREIITII